MHYTCFEDTCYFYSNFLLNAKVARSLKSAYEFSQEHKQTKRLMGGIQIGGCRTVVFDQQKKGSVWSNLLNWSEPLKKNNDFYDMTFGALLWLTIPLKTIIKLTCVWPDGLTWAKIELRSLINHECRVVTKTNNGKVIFDMWVEFNVGSFLCPEGFPSGLPVSFPPQEQTLQIPVETVETRATSWNVHC